MDTQITVNNRRYTIPPRKTVGICLDGTAPEYLEAAAQEMPALRKIISTGTSGIVQTAMPSFTNPNNLSIATGVPPAIHGVCGNTYWDAERDEEVMMNHPRFLQAETLFAHMARSGLRVGVVTAKDKLARLLGHGLDGICLSVEAAANNKAQHPSARVAFPETPPGVYDPACSIACIQAGAHLLREDLVDFLYLTTTDYVQHKHAPVEDEAIAFYRKLDDALAALQETGAALGITADHGMNSKTTPAGHPNVRYLESKLLDSGFKNPRVILPITDPYVVHHGALGSFACVYLDSTDKDDEARSLLLTLEGIEQVLTREEAAVTLNLAPDRIGDLVVLADAGTVLGRTPDWHDLSAVQNGLRSHGGLHENRVPLIVNSPLSRPYQQRLESGDLRNYDLFDILCNGLGS